MYPRSIRTNNPGAMNYGPFASKWGAIGTDGRLAIFPDEATGYKAMGALLDVYNRRGQNTVASIIGGTPDNPNRAWAPRGVDNNSTDDYIKSVSAKLGIDPNAPLTPEHRDGLMKAMAEYEAGRAVKGPGGGQVALAPQQPMPQPMALGGPTQASGGQAPMAGENRKPSLMDEIAARTANPLFQQGLGLFLASAQGKDMNAGLSEGQQRARSMQETLMKNLALQREAQQREAVQSVMSNPQAMQGVPPALVQMARATGDPSAVVNWMSRTQRDPLATRHQELQNKVLERQLSQPQKDGSVVEKVGDQLVRVTPGGQAEVVYGANPVQAAEQAVAARRAQAVAAGMDPESGPVKTFIATGKMPREDQAPLTATDKKAIIEADDQVIAATNVINLLREAERINPQAHTGALASTRATIGNMLPDVLVPDALASKGSSEATANFENLVLGQALAQLKSTFGAAPTEGERKILIELQGSVNQPVSVRQDILRRAKALAEKRLRENQERASQLRAGTFYKPEGAKAGGGATGASSVLDEARAAISKGAPREAVIQRLRERGIDPAGL